MDTSVEVDYPSTQELREALKETTGLKIEEENTDFFTVWDEFASSDGLTDRFIRFNKKNMVSEKLIEAFGNDVEKYDLNTFLNSIPKILLMNVKKIYFIKTEGQLEKLYEEDETPNHTFDLESLGMNVWADGTVILSLTAHEKACDQEAKEDLKVFGFSDYEEKLKLSVWQTLVRELYHSLQANPLFEHEIEQGEIAAENFCRDFFQEGA